VLLACRSIGRGNLLQHAMELYRETCEILLRWIGKTVACAKLVAFPMTSRDQWIYKWYLTAA